MKGKGRRPKAFCYPSIKNERLKYLLTIPEVPAEIGSGHENRVRYPERQLLVQGKGDEKGPTNSEYACWSVTRKPGVESRHGLSWRYE